MATIITENSVTFSITEITALRGDLIKTWRSLLEGRFYEGELQDIIEHLTRKELYGAPYESVITQE